MCGGAHPERCAAGADGARTAHRNQAASPFKEEIHDVIPSGRQGFAAEERTSAMYTGDAPG